MDIPIESEPGEDASTTTSNVGKCFNIDMSDRSESDISSTPPPKGLVARLAMGSKERRIHSEHNLKKTAALTASSGNVIAGTEEIQNVSRKTSERSQVIDRVDGSEEPSKAATAKSPPTVEKHIAHVFNWQSQRDAGNGQLCIFIAHDNPQVGAAVAERVFSEGPMHVMMEFKEDSSGHVCFLLGAIVYSGDTEGVEGAMLENPRGSQFLVITDVIAIRGELTWFPTRVMGDISEIDLDGVKIPGLIGGGGVRSHVDVSTEEKLSSFLRGGSGRVDIILDPAHSSMWYPFFEGKRKIAPQFRSQGVGYIRLGDDMSRFGTAFISLDAGSTYLDHGAGSVVASTNASNNPSSPPARARKILKQKPVPFLAQTVIPRSRSGSDAEGNSTSTPPKVAAVVAAAAAAVGAGAGAGGQSAVKPSRDVPTTPQSRVRSQRGTPNASAGVAIGIGAGAGAGVNAGVSVSAGHSQVHSPTGSTGNSVSTTPAVPTPLSTKKHSAAQLSTLKKGASNTDMFNDPAAMKSPRGEGLVRKGTGTFSTNKELEEIRSIAHSLKESDQFWSERMELLRRLHVAITNMSTSSSISSSSSDGHTNPKFNPLGSPTPRSMDGSTVSSMTGTSAGTHIFEFPTHIVTDVIAALIKCITRQKNPHVIRGAVSVVRVIGPHAALATPTGIAWRSLLIETIQLLRVSNKPVSDQARDTLTGIHGLAITISSISALLDDVFNGPNGKNAGASNTAKVIAWLEGMVKVEAIANVAHLRDAAAVCPFDKADCGLLFLRCKHLLSHKEEATRDAAIELSGMFLAYEVIVTPGQSYVGLKELVQSIAKAAKLIDEGNEPADVTMADPMSARKLVNTTPFSKSFRALEFVGSPEGGMNVSRSSLIRKASSRRVSAANMAGPAAAAVAAAAAATSSSPTGGAGGIILGALTGSIIKTVSELESRALKLYEKVMLSATRVLIELMSSSRRLRKHRQNSGDSIPNETAYESLHDTLATIDHTGDTSYGDLNSGPASPQGATSSSNFPAVTPTMMSSHADLYASYEDREIDVLREQLPPPERRGSISPSVASSRRNSNASGGPSTPKWRLSLGGGGSGGNKNTVGLMASPDGTSSPPRTEDLVDEDMVLSLEKKRLRDAINRLEASSEIDVASAAERDGTSSPNAALRKNSAAFLNDLGDDAAVVTDLNAVFDHIDELTSPSRSQGGSRSPTPVATPTSTSTSTLKEATTGGATTSDRGDHSAEGNTSTAPAAAASIIDIEAQLTARLDGGSVGDATSSSTVESPAAAVTGSNPVGQSTTSNPATTTPTVATAATADDAKGETSTSSSSSSSPTKGDQHHVKFVTPTSTTPSGSNSGAVTPGSVTSTSQSQSPANNNNMNRSRSGSNLSTDSGAVAALSAAALQSVFHKTASSRSLTAASGTASGATGTSKSSSPSRKEKTSLSSSSADIAESGLRTAAENGYSISPATSTAAAMAAAALIPLPLTPERQLTPNLTPSGTGTSTPRPAFGDVTTAISSTVNVDATSAAAADAAAAASGISNAVVTEQDSGNETEVTAENNTENAATDTTGTTSIAADEKVGAAPAVVTTATETATATATAPTTVVTIPATPVDGTTTASTSLESKGNASGPVASALPTPPTTTTGSGNGTIQANKASGNANKDSANTNKDKDKDNQPPTSASCGGCFPFFRSRK